MLKKLGALILVCSFAFSANAQIDIDDLFDWQALDSIISNIIIDDFDDFNWNDYWGGLPDTVPSNGPGDIGIPDLNSFDDFFNFPLDSIDFGGGFGGNPWDTIDYDPDNYGYGDPWDSTGWDDYGNGNPWDTIDWNGGGNGDPWDTIDYDPDNYGYGDPWDTIDWDNGNDNPWDTIDWDNGNGNPWDTIYWDNYGYDDPYDTLVNDPDNYPDWLDTIDWDNYGYGDPWDTIDWNGGGNGDPWDTIDWDNGNDNPWDTIYWDNYGYDDPYDTLVNDPDNSPGDWDDFLCDSIIVIPGGDTILVQVPCGGIQSSEEDQFRTTETSFEINEIYPNPAIDLLNVQFTSPIEEELLVNVFNVNGRAVQQFIHPPNTQLQIQVSDLNSGMYWVQIQHQNKTITKQFLVK